jgi:hypothetical protein
MKNIEKEHLMMDKNFEWILFFSSDLKKAYQKFDDSFAVKVADLLYEGDLETLREECKVHIDKKSGEDYVSESEYLRDQDSFIIYLSPAAFETIDKKLDKEGIKTQIRSTIVQEYVHEQQNQLLARSKHSKDISQYHSIESYAGRVACEMKKTLGRNEAIEKFNSEDFSGLDVHSMEIIKHYKMLSPSVYKKFLTEMNACLTREPSTHITNLNGLGAKIASSNVIGLGKKVIEDLRSLNRILFKLAENFGSENTSMMEMSAQTCYEIWCLKDKIARNLKTMAVEIETRNQMIPYNKDGVDKVMIKIMSQYAFASVNIELNASVGERFSKELNEIYSSLNELSTAINAYNLLAVERNWPVLLTENEALAEAKKVINSITL